MNLALADYPVHPRDLVHHRWDQGLAAETGVDRHHDNEVEPVEHIFDRRLRRRRVQRNARLLPERADFLQRSVKMRGRFGVNGDDVLKASR